MNFYVCVIAKCHDLSIVGVLANYNWGCKYDELYLKSRELSEFLVLGVLRCDCKFYDA